MPSDLQDDLSAEYDFADYANWSLENWRESSGYDDQGSSEWCEAGEQEAAIKVFQSCLFAAIFLFGVAGNGLVMATFAANRCRGPRSVTDVFLFQLALADFLLLLTLPLQAADTNTGWIFSAPVCKVTRAVYAVNTYGGLLLLACISVDRYLAVVSSRARRKFARLATAAVWLTALLLSLPELLFSGVSGSGRDAYCGTLAGAAVKTATNAAAVAVFALSFLLMAACYLAIARILRAGSETWLRRRHTLKLMMALVLLFLLFQLPHSVVVSLKMARPLCAPVPEYVTCTLAFARCCLNPVMYALVGGRFRSEALKLLRGHRTGLRASVSTPTKEAV
nr:C-C chemokine receptor type 10-like [Nerophis lumbriciformis]